MFSIKEKLKSFENDVEKDGSGKLRHITVFKCLIPVGEYHK
jgi:hypothetical protein